MEQDGNNEPRGKQQIQGKQSVMRPPAPSVNDIKLVKAESANSFQATGWCFILFTETTNN